MNSKTLQISEQLWSVAEKMIPELIYKGKGSLGGRPDSDPRLILTGIFYVLTTGCQWRRLPCEFGPANTVFRYFRKWVKLGVFDAIWCEALKIYDDKKGIAWNWQAIDGSIKNSYFGKEKVRFNPKNVNHGATKIMVLSDKKGIPVSAIINMKANLLKRRWAIFVLKGLIHPWGFNTFVEIKPTVQFGVVKVQVSMVM